MRPIRTLIVTGFLIASCSNGNSSTPLRSATDVINGRATKATIGKPVKVSDATIIVNDVGPSADFDPTQPWQVAFIVTIRSENHTGKDLQNPDIEVHCDGIDDAGSWYVSSTWKVGDTLPAHSFREGTLDLDYPETSTGIARACTNPILETTDGGSKAVEWPITSQPGNLPTG